MKHHGNHSAARHGHDEGGFGPFRAALYFLVNPRGVGNHLVLERSDLRKSDVLLDIGSGPGTAVIEAVKRYGVARSIDLEPAGFLQKASHLRAKIRGAGDNTEFVGGTAEAIPLEDASVDVVVAVNSLHHWADIDRGLAEVARVLRPAGRFVACDEDFSHGDHPRGTDPHADWPAVDYDHTSATLQTLGLTTEKSRAQDGQTPVMLLTATKQ